MSHSLFLAAFLVCMFGIGCFCLIAMIVACARKSWKIAIQSIAWSLGASIGVTGLLFLLLYLSCRPYDPTSEIELREAYSTDFGELPPPGITVLKARQTVVGDSGCQWLLLKATPEAIQTHISKGFVASKDLSPDFRGQAGPRAPKWWNPPTAGLEFYENREWKKDGAWFSSEAAMGIDRISGTIWFIASKFD